MLVFVNEHKGEICKRTEGESEKGKLRNEHKIDLEMF